MKIINFQAENVKKLVAVDITPEENVVEIRGSNGAGKSSILDAIYFALGGTKSHQSKVIRSGEDEAVIRLDLGDIVVRRTFTKRPVKDAEGEVVDTRVTTAVTVETEEGAKYGSPQRMLDNLVGSISFDPLKFARMDPREQYDVLRDLSGIDQEELAALQKCNREDYAERAIENRKARDLRARAAAIEVPDDTPDEEVSVESIMQRLDEAQDFNERLKIDGATRARRREQYSELESEAAGYRQQIEELKRAIARCETGMHRLEEEMKAENPMPDFVPEAPIREELSTVEERNAQVRNKKDRARIEAEAAEAEKKSAKYTKLMDDRTAKMRKAVEDADMPVEGLMLADGQVMYRDSDDSEPHPFEVLSDAEQLRISCAIAMRENSKLRVIRIRDGSLLDDTSLAVLRQMADKEDYQVWIEIVDTGGKIGIVIEDGMVKAAEVQQEA